MFKSFRKAASIAVAVLLCAATMSARDIGANKPEAKKAASRLRTMVKNTQSSTLSLDEWKQFDTEAKPLGETLGNTVKGGAIRDSAIEVRGYLHDIHEAVNANSLSKAKGLAGKALPELERILDWAGR